MLVKYLDILQRYICCLVALLFISSRVCADSNSAYEASTFIDKAGIVIQYHKQVYRDLGDPVILELLDHLGIKHVSTESGTWSQPLEDYSKFLRDASRDLGITFAITADPNFENSDPHDDNDPEFFASKVGALIAGGKPWPDWHPSRADLVGGASVDYLIGDKEPDHTPSFDTSCPRQTGENGLTQTIRCYPEQLRRAPTYQTELTAAAQANPNLSSVPMISSPLVNVPSYQATMFDGQSIWNFMQPIRAGGSFGSINLYCWTGSIGACRSNYYNTWENFFTPKQVLVTETGYYTQANSVDDNTVATVNEQAEYLIASMLDMYVMNVRRYYLYSAVDNPYASTPKERSFGVFYSDGTPKLAANAISMLMTMFDDSQAVEVEETPLSYEISGGTSKLRHIKFTRKDGKHIIAVWNELPSLSASHITESSISISFSRAVRFEKYIPSELVSESVQLGSSTSFNLGQDPVLLLVDEIPPTPTPTSTAIPTATPIVTSTPAIPINCEIEKEVIRKKVRRLKFYPNNESVGKVVVRIYKVEGKSKSLKQIAKKKASKMRPATLSLENLSGAKLRLISPSCGTIVRHRVK